MTTLDATEARTRLRSLIDEAAHTHRPNAAPTGVPSA